MPCSAGNPVLLAVALVAVAGAGATLPETASPATRTEASPGASRGQQNAFDLWQRVERLREHADREPTRSGPTLAQFSKA